MREVKWPLVARLIFTAFLNPSLVPDNLGDDRRLDVDVDLGQVLSGVDVHGVEETVLYRRLER